MKCSIPYLLIFCFTGLSFSTNNKTKAPVTVQGNSTFTVLELFTSEGCSSCPPADKLLSELAGNNNHIIPLSFHVDYWNRLGWTDPFSSSVYSDWQQQYANHFQLESIYTPQLVVNGEYELVGSNRAKAESAIQKTLNENSPVTILIRDVTSNGDKIKCRVELSGDLKKQELVVLLLQKEAIVKVKAGENEGATLSHINIVRYLSRHDAKETNEIVLDIPPDLPEKNRKIVAYTRRKSDLKISAAVSY